VLAAPLEHAFPPAQGAVADSAAAKAVLDIERVEHREDGVVRESHLYAAGVSSVRVGGFDVDGARAEEFVLAYVRPPAPAVTGYPIYDLLTTASQPDRLVDGDLLAPSLLDAPVGAQQFAALKAVQRDLENALENIPTDLDLSTLADQELGVLAPLFGVLDGLVAQASGVGPVIFSKVLHRKRPKLIPIMDANVLSVWERGLVCGFGEGLRGASRSGGAAARCFAKLRGAVGGNGQLGDEVTEVPSASTKLLP
jgi:hypothetical protein